jgi:DNA-binding response OmpR family regulator
MMAIAPLKSKVLVIDDQPETAELVAALLRRVGYQVSSAGTGVEGIALARKEEFDLVLLDIDLPDMTGFDLCAYLKQDFRYCRTPIVFVSGRPGEESRRRCFELGAADFIAKPFDPFVFVSRIVMIVKPVKD